MSKASTNQKGNESSTKRQKSLQSEEENSPLKQAINESSSIQITAKPKEFSNLQSPKKNNFNNDSDKKNIKISSNEFREKVYPRFEKFIQNRDEKIENEKKLPESKKISAKEFAENTLSRFDNFTKKKEHNKHKIIEDQYEETTGKKKNDEIKMTEKEFNDITLKRFQIFETRAKEKKQELISESLEEEYRSMQKGGVGSSQILSPNSRDSKLSGSMFKSGKGVPAPIDEEFIKKLENFEIEKKRWIKEQKFELEEKTKMKELSECTFKPNIDSEYNKNSKNKRDPDQLIYELNNWKKTVEARHVQDKMSVFLQEKDLFQPKISENSKKILEKKNYAELPVQERLLKAKKNLRIETIEEEPANVGLKKKSMTPKPRITQENIINQKSLDQDDDDPDQDVPLLMLEKFMKEKNVSKPPNLVELKLGALEGLDLAIQPQKTEISPKKINQPKDSTAQKEKTNKKSLEEQKKILIKQQEEEEMARQKQKLKKEKELREKMKREKENELNNKVKQLEQELKTIKEKEKKDSEELARLKEENKKLEQENASKNFKETLFLLKKSFEAENQELLKNSTALPQSEHETKTNNQSELLVQGKREKSLPKIINNVIDIDQPSEKQKNEAQDNINKNKSTKKKKQASELISKKPVIEIEDSITLTDEGRKNKKPDKVEEKKKKTIVRRKKKKNFTRSQPKVQFTKK